MDLQKMADKSLDLTKEERELLAKRLIASLRSPPAEEILLDAIIEAERRVKALDNNELEPMREEEIMLDMQRTGETLQ